ncbi:glycosyltransferase family 4 protein [Vibrio cholerae]|uniref:glycosyltransferase family 4 protein n=1 Tax=Vibrio cholerae TaxID=666 RepID=UPI0037290990
MARVLVDLCLGHKKFGFSGIPQDTRLLFNGLLKSPILDVEGLLWSNNDTWKFGDLTKLDSQANFISSHMYGKLNIDFSILDRILRRISPYLGTTKELFFDGIKKNYGLYDIDKNLIPIIWRQVFSGTIPVSDMERIVNANYKLTDLTYIRANLPLVSKKSGVLFSKPHIKADTFDFVIFQDARYISLPSKVKKIIRYHDGLPVLSADTMMNARQTKIHYESVLKASNDNSIFVCNSTSSLEDLSIISPKAARNAVVIPYFLPKMEPISDVKPEVLESIFKSRVSSAVPINDSKLKANMDGLFNSGVKPRFIMSLATIEPRKNYIGLIDAWQKYRLETGDDIKLVIVGSPGWEFGGILSKMKPYVESGELIHLEKVAQHELPYLYSSAHCFIFPSFGEGFGLPPSEAMQCGCPVAMSDIPAHRYSAGKGAIYFEPYDTDDIVAKLKALCSDSSESQRLRHEMIQLGYDNAKRYTVDAVLPQWEELFEKNM